MALSATPIARTLHRYSPHQTPMQRRRESTSRRPKRIGVAFLSGYINRGAHYFESTNTIQHWPCQLGSRQGQLCRQTHRGPPDSALSYSMQTIFPAVPLASVMKIARLEKSEVPQLPAINVPLVAPLGG